MHNAYVNPLDTTRRPWNFQARVLTSNRRKAHAVERGVFEPDLNATIRSYFRLDYVGLTNFFHESRCLLLHRLAYKTESLTRFFNKTCRCNADGTAPRAHEEHVIHGAATVHSDTPLSAELEAKIDRLTRIDAGLFLVALKHFFVEMKWLETSIGRKVMCRHTLLHARDKLLYITDVVTEFRNA